MKRIDSIRVSFQVELSLSEFTDKFYERLMSYAIRVNYINSPAEWEDLALSDQKVIIEAFFAEHMGVRAAYPDYSGDSAVVVFNGRNWVKKAGFSVPEDSDAFDVEIA